MKESPAPRARLGAAERLLEGTRVLKPWVHVALSVGVAVAVWFLPDAAVRPVAVIEALVLPLTGVLVARTLGRDAWLYSAPDTGAEDTEPGSTRPSVRAYTRGGRAELRRRGSARTDRRPPGAGGLAAVSARRGGPVGAVVGRTQATGGPGGQRSAGAVRPGALVRRVPDADRGTPTSAVGRATGATALPHTGFRARDKPSVTAPHLATNGRAG